MTPLQPARQEAEERLRDAIESQGGTRVILRLPARSDRREERHTPARSVWPRTRSL